MSQENHPAPRSGIKGSGSPALQPHPAEQSIGGREARRCPSMSWGLGPGLSVSSSLGPRRGCRQGPYGAESRVTCPLGCFPISPTWTLETPTPACASVTWSPARLHRELPVLCALSARGLALRPYIPPLPLTVTLALTLLVLLTWPGPTQPGLSSAGPGDCLLGSLPGRRSLLSLSRWGGLAGWESSPMEAALNCSCEGVDGLRPQLPNP